MLSHPWDDWQRGSLDWTEAEVQPQILRLFAPQDDSLGGGEAGEVSRRLRKPRALFTRWSRGTCTGGVRVALGEGVCFFKK